MRAVSFSRANSSSVDANSPAFIVKSYTRIVARHGRSATGPNVLRRSGTLNSSLPSIARRMRPPARVTTSSKTRPSWTAGGWPRRLAFARTPPPEKTDPSAPSNP